MSMFTEIELVSNENGWPAIDHLWSSTMQVVGTLTDVPADLYQILV